jgi:hypothetical protein
LSINAIVFTVERGTTMPPKIQPNDEPNPDDATPKSKVADAEAPTEKAETANAE